MARASIAVSIGEENQVEAWIVTVIADVLAQGLELGGELRVVPASSVARAITELRLSEELESDAREVLRRNLGADHLVSIVGRIEGETLVLGMRVDEDTAHLEGTVDSLADLALSAAQLLRPRFGASVLDDQSLELLRARLPSDPSAARLHAEGLAHLRGFELGAAREALNGAAEADPENPRIQADLAAVLAALGNDGAAATTAQRALELAAGLDIESRQMIQARALEIGHRWREAIEVLDRLWSQRPDDLEIGLRLGRAQSQAGQTVDAEETLAALRSRPGDQSDDPRIDLLAATIFSLKSDYNQELAAVQAAIDKAQQRGASLLVAEALIAQAWALRHLGRNGEAVQVCTDARWIYSAAGDRRGYADSIYYTALAQSDWKNPEEALAIFAQALRIYREIGDLAGESNSLNASAIVLWEQGQLEEAEARYQRALDIAREVGNQENINRGLVNTGLVKLDRSLLNEAQVLFAEALEMSRGMGHRRHIAWASLGLGRTALNSGDIATATRYLIEGAAVSEEIGHQRLSGYLHHALGEMRLMEGQAGLARRQLERSIELRDEQGETRTGARTRLSLAEVEIDFGSIAAARTLALEALEVAAGEAAMLDVQCHAEMLLAKIEIHLDQKRASDHADAATRLCASSEIRLLRLRVAVVTTEVEAASAPPSLNIARRRLGALMIEAARAGLPQAEIEARLALADIDLADGKTEEAGRQRREALALALNAGYGRYRKLNGG